MIIISKKEKDYILSKAPNAHIRRTMKKSSKRHRYYCEESEAIMMVISDYRQLHTK